MVHTFFFSLLQYNWPVFPVCLLTFCILADRILTGTVIDKSTNSLIYPDLIGLETVISGPFLISLLNDEKTPLSSRDQHVLSFFLIQAHTYHVYLHDVCLQYNHK
jgi:ABC-type transport system involved in multi-copper enzyme maturation permease subunit